MLVKSLIGMSLLLCLALGTGCANVVVIADDSLQIERHGNTLIITCVCDECPDTRDEADEDRLDDLSR